MNTNETITSSIYQQLPLHFRAHGMGEKLKIKDNVLELRGTQHVAPAGCIVNSLMKKGGFSTFYYPTHEAWKRESEEPYFESMRFRTRNENLEVTRVYVIPHQELLSQDAALIELMRADAASGIKVMACLEKDVPSKQAYDFGLWDQGDAPGLAVSVGVKNESDKSDLTHITFSQDDAVRNKFQQWSEQIKIAALPQSALPIENQITNHTWDESVAEDWRYTVSPSRPSASEQAIIDRWFRKYPKGSKLLILGSTAEFRDMAFAHQFKTTVVDYNPQVFKILKKCMRHPESENITVDHRNWLDLDFQNEFDLIVGDLAVNMVAKSQQKQLVQTLIRSLKPGGAALQRIWVRHPIKYQKSNTTFRAMIDEHYQGRSGFHYFYSLALPFINFFHDEELEETRFQDILNYLRQAQTNKEISAECLQDFERPWGRYSLPNRLALREDLEEAISKAGQLLDIEHGEDFFSPMCPIYVFGK